MGPPVTRQVLDPLAVFTSTNVYKSSLYATVLCSSTCRLENRHHPESVTSQVNVENVKNDFNEYPDDDFGVIATDDDDEIAGRRRYISVAAINAAKVRKRGGQNSSPISPPNWNWNEPSSQSGKSIFSLWTASAVGLLGISTSF